MASTTLALTQALVTQPVMSKVSTSEDFSHWKRGVLKKAEAPRLAGVLNDMLRPSSTGQVTAEARELQEQIRLLNVRSTAKDKIPPLDLRKPIKISSDPAVSGQQGSNSLIISSTPENLKAMRAIVELMDVVPLADGVRVRIIRLKNADAASTMQVLRDIFDRAADQLSGRPRTSVAGKAEPDSVSGKALVSPVAIAADLRTNTLIISGTEESLAFAELILHMLEKDPEARCPSTSEVSQRLEPIARS